MTIPSTVCDLKDLFAGGGGSSTGAKAAGRGLFLRYALNHDATAVMVHNQNHPEADHFLGNVRTTDPRKHPRTRIMICSPSCTDFTAAKIHKYQVDLNQYPMFEDDAKRYEAAIAERQSRSTMWDVVRFTRQHRYDIVICENVWQVRNWENYRSWWEAMENLGYAGQTVYLNSMFLHALNGVKNSDFAPQSRDRWYTVWRKKSIKPVNLDFHPLAPCLKCERNIQAVQGWRNSTHQYGAWNRNYDYYCPVCAERVVPYFYPAIWCIDFSIPIKRIDDPTRKNAISPKTKRRIRAGLEKYGHPLNLDKARGDKARSALLYPLFTQTGTATQTMTFLPQMIDLSRSHSAKNDRGHIRNGLSEPGFTITSADTLGLVISTKHSNDVGSDGSLIQPITKRGVFTITNHPSQGVVLPGWIVELYGSGTMRSLDADELNTVTSGGGKSGLALQFISTYNGNSIYAGIQEDSLPTVTTVVRHGFTQGELDHMVEECYYRTLRPTPELIRAMGVPGDYNFSDAATGKRLPGYKITKLLGQMVTPCVMEWLVSRALDALDDQGVGSNCYAD